MSHSPGRERWNVLRRAALLLALFGLAAVLLGARCIERVHTYVDGDGYAHITGEMDNDTDIQGTQIMLQGTLTDAQGNIVAQKIAPTCPPDTQPHQQTVFDIRFDNPNLPPWTKLDVRPVAGKTLSSPLPAPKVAVISTDAARFVGFPPIPGINITDKDVLVGFDVRNQSSQVLTGVQGCMAVYDQSGSVTFVSSDEILEIGADNLPHPASLPTTQPVHIFMIAKNVPAGPVQVRAWLWFGNKGAPTSAYQFITTGMITIQTVSGP